MSDIGVAEIPPADGDQPPLPPLTQRATKRLLWGSFLPTLLWLAGPNVVALSGGTCVVIAETSYIGRLGTESLAAMGPGVSFCTPTLTLCRAGQGGRVSS